MRHLAAATVSRVVSLPSIWTGDYTKIAKLARRRASRAGRFLRSFAASCSFVENLAVA